MLFSRTILCTLAGLAISPLAFTAEIFVSPSGSDAPGNTGTNPNAPLATISRAAALAVAGDTVTINSGTYRESIRPARSGQPGSPITYRAANGATVIVSGADPLTGWTNLQGNLWQVTLNTTFNSTLYQREQLFWGEEMLNVARHPNLPDYRARLTPDGMVPIGTVITTDGSNDYQSKQIHLTEGTNVASSAWGPLTIGHGGALKVRMTIPALGGNDGDFTGATFFSIIQDTPGGGWGFGQLGPVLSHSGGIIEAIVFQHPAALGEVSPGDPCYMIGKQAFLDTPGEWFRAGQGNTMAASTGPLTVWLPDSGNPNNAAMSIKRRDYAFDLSDRSYIHLQNIQIFAATVTTDNALLSPGLRTPGGWGSAGRGKNNFAASHHITLEGLTVTYPSSFDGCDGYPHGQWDGASGVVLSGSDHTIRNCRISQSPGNGISVAGQRHVISNNVIHDINWTAAHCSGISLRDTSIDIDIDQNTIVRTGWNGIGGRNLLSTSPNAPSRVRRNRIEACGLLTQDVGGLRFVSRQDEEGDLPLNGTRIHHNIVRGVVMPLGNGLYFDYCGDYVVDHNLIYESNNAINQNANTNMVFVNNTAMGWLGSIGGILGGNEANRQRDVIVRNNAMSHMCLRMTNDPVSPNPDIHPTYVQDHNIISYDNVAFRNPAMGDFTLNSTAAMINAGVAMPPHTGTTVQAPDVGAFEFGGVDWTSDVGAISERTLRPTNLRALARADGSVTMRWNNPNPIATPFGVVKTTAVVHNNGGWEARHMLYTMPGWTQATLWSTTANREQFLRVFAPTTAHTNEVRLRSGRAGYRNNLFTSQQGFALGSLHGQVNWERTSAADTEQNQQVVNYDGARRLRLTGSCELRAFGDLAQVDRGFNPMSSSATFSFRWRLNQVSGDGNDAVSVGIGGPNFWSSEFGRSVNQAAINFVLRRNGGIYSTGEAGYQGLGEIKNYTPGDTTNTGWCEVKGVLDYQTRQIRNLTFNGIARNSNWPMNLDHQRMETCQWNVNGKPLVANQEVYLDALTLQVNNKPTVWVAARKDSLTEGDLEGGVIWVSRDVVDGNPLTVNIGIAPDSVASASEVSLSYDQDNSPLTSNQVVIPAFARSVAVRVRANNDALSEGQEVVKVALSSGSSYLLDSSLDVRYSLLAISDMSPGSGNNAPPTISKPAAAGSNNIPLP